MGKNIREMSITMLREIQDKNGFSRTKMAALLDVNEKSKYIYISTKDQGIK